MKKPGAIDIDRGQKLLVYDQAGRVLYLEAVERRVVFRVTDHYGNPGRLIPTDQWGVFGLTPGRAAGYDARVADNS